MEDTPLAEMFGCETATDRLGDAIDLDRAGNALDMRRARLLAVIKRKDLAPLGYGTFRAFCAEHVDAGDTRIRQLITLAESPFAHLRAAVVQGKLAPSVAARAVRHLDLASEEAWVAATIAGGLPRKRREPAPEVEFTQEEAEEITNARAIARINLGQHVSEGVADREILRAFREQDSREKLLRAALTPPPAPAPLPEWTGPDPADALVGPWQEPEDAGHAVALLRLVTAMRADRIRQLAVALEVIAQREDYRAADFRSFESWVDKWLSVDIRTIQRYRKALDEQPDLEMLRALFVQDVATEDTREEWAVIAPRVPMAELERVRVLARRGLDRKLREAYLHAIATVDAERIPELADGATKTARRSLVSLADTLPPAPAPRAVLADPDLLEAARWYYEHGKPPTLRGIARIKERYRHTCVNPECARRTLRLHVHHRKPRSKGGTDAKENLDPLCPACHLRLRHSGHMSLEQNGDRLVFTFADREITMFGYTGIGVGPRPPDGARVSATPDATPVPARDAPPPPRGRRPLPPRRAPE